MCPGAATHAECPGCSLSPQFRQSDLENGLWQFARELKYFGVNLELVSRLKGHQWLSYCLSADAMCVSSLPAPCCDTPPLYTRTLENQHGTRSAYVSSAQLALTKGKEIHWTEYGVGGGTCQSGNCIAEVSRAQHLQRVLSARCMAAAASLLPCISCAYDVHVALLCTALYSVCMKNLDVARYPSRRSAGCSTGRQQVLFASRQSGVPGAQLLKQHQIHSWVGPLVLWTVQTASQAAHYPFFGIWGPYRAEMDPWQLNAKKPPPPREYLWHFYNQTAAYLADQVCMASVPWL